MKRGSDYELDYVKHNNTNTNSSDMFREKVNNKVSSKKVKVNNDIAESNIEAHNKNSSQHSSKNHKVNDHISHKKNMYVYLC